MGNGSCLIARLDNGGEAVLFEGGNRIPFFWLTLLGQEDIEAYYGQISLPQQKGTEPRKCRFELDKIRALVRAADRRDYVAQYYAPCLPLFDDWLYFMQITDFSDRKIYLDPGEACTCHETPERFADSLRKVVVSFDSQGETWYESTIAATCGYEGRNRLERRFGDFSEVCREMNRKDIYSRYDKKIHLEKNRFTGKKIARAIFIILCVVLLAAAVFFLYF
jgi:hypothetical protein